VAYKKKGAVVVTGYRSKLENCVVARESQIHRKDSRNYG